MSTDLFRCAMSPDAGEAVKRLYTPDADGRVYCGEGHYTQEFENAFAQATRLDRSPLGVNSCTQAIDLALHLIGVGARDQVIVSPMTCSASNGPAVLRGAGLVWADVDPLTGLIDPASVARLLTLRTKAIIAVDWAGRKCNYDALRRVAGDVPIIEDAAHCLYLGPTRGDYVAYSFGPIKALTTGGYGGALLVPPALRDAARLLRWHGLDRLSKASFRCEQDITAVGFRAHMTDDQAVVGLANLPLATAGVATAREHAAWYHTALANVPGIRLPPHDPTCDYWLFGVLVDGDRDTFEARMATQGIPTSRAHARNDRHTAYARAAVGQDGNLPGVAYFDDHQTNIPVGHWVEQDELEHIAQAVIAALPAATI